MKAHGEGNGCIERRFLDLGTSWMLSGEFHSPLTLSPGRRALRPH
jgi:hypothetical protein